MVNQTARKRRASKAPQRGPDQESGGNDLVVVGIGASAGGVSALERFFAEMPDEPGFAIGVVLHLLSKHESSLAEIIQRHTRMPVIQVVETVQVEPNHVYVIPPDKDLSIADGLIRLTEPEREKGRRIPIDFFFRTLADSLGERSVGVVLTGTGADGAIGLARIKEMGGVTMVQDPEEAEYPEMPQSAIARGFVDCILPLAAIPKQLASYMENLKRIVLPVEIVEIAPPTHAPVVDELREILTLFKARTGHNFAYYKRSTILRRIERRMQVTEVTSLTDYLEYLRKHPPEVQALMRDLLISVTNFFRDKESWDMLESRIVPEMFHGKDASDSVRVWVAGCATGEEAYSLAILLSEYASRLPMPPKVQIFASDLDERAIASAREGVYPDTIAGDVSEERLRRFFVREGSHYRVSKDIREMILFARHDVLKDPPFSRLDLVSCRNLLIYLNKDAQQQLLELFHFALKPDGKLFLGMSESTDGVSYLYSTMDKKYHIFARRSVPLGTEKIPTLPRVDVQRRLQSDSPTAAQRMTSFSEAHQILLEQYAPPSVVVNEGYDIVHLSSNAGRYLQLVGGEPSYNLMRVIHPDLRLDLRSSLYNAVERGIASETRRVRMRLSGSERMVRLIVRPVREPSPLEGYVLVMFDEIDESIEAARASEDGHALAPVARQLEAEAHQLREQLRVTIEQYETSTEELKASNEELQAMNEELRSATEELETSKEELQAVNEELMTVNQELKNKVDEVSRVNSDLQNLMSSSDIGTVFLDREMNVKRFTPAAQKIFNIIPSDLYRPMSHITHRLEHDDITRDVGLVLQRLTTVEREVHSADGEWYLMRINPYRTLEDRIDGVVLSFIDITRRKSAEEEREALIQQLKEERSRFEAVVEQMPAGLFIAEAPSGRLVYRNTHAALLWGSPEVPMPSSIEEYGTVYTGFRPDGTQLRSEDWPIVRAIANGENVIDDEIQMVVAGGERTTMLISASPVRNSEGNIVAGVVTWYDLTQRKQMEDDLHRSQVELKDRVAERTSELADANESLRVEAVERERLDHHLIELLKALVNAQEDERRRISRELHDQLGQSLTGLNMVLELAAKDPAGAGRIRLQEAQTMVGDLLLHVRELSQLLRPPLLDDMGLLPALISLIQQYSEQAGVEVDFTHSGLDTRLDPDVETAVYRIVQEALTNVVRHSGSQSVTLQIVADVSLTLRIVDVGEGFDMDEVLSRGSSGGLRGMYDRAQLLGGELTVESSPEDGTSIYLEIPEPRGRSQADSADGLTPNGRTPDTGSDTIPAVRRRTKGSPSNSRADGKVDKV